MPNLAALDFPEVTRWGGRRVVHCGTLSGRQEAAWTTGCPADGSPGMLIFTRRRRSSSDRRFVFMGVGGSQSRGSLPSRRLCLLSVPAGKKKKKQIRQGAMTDPTLYYRGASITGRRNYRLRTWLWLCSGAFTWKTLHWVWIKVPSDSIRATLAELSEFIQKVTAVNQCLSAEDLSRFHRHFSLVLVVVLDWMDFWDQQRHSFVSLFFISWSNFFSFTLMVQNCWQGNKEKPLLNRSVAVPLMQKQTRKILICSVFMLYFLVLYLQSMKVQWWIIQL